MSRPGILANTWTRLALAAVVLGAAVFGILYSLRAEAPVAAAVRGKAVRAVVGSVEVFAEYAQELKSAVSGRVAESSLDIGRRVTAGDVLVQLDTGDIDLEIERIRAELAAAKRKVEVGSTLRADVENMRDTVANFERQVKLGSFPQAELDKQRRSLQQLEQRMDLDNVNLRLSLDTLQNSLKGREREKSKMTIAAPLEGVITSVMARPGDLIANGMPIATIMTISRTVEGKLSEENFAAVKVGQRASVRFLTYGKDQYNARVAKLLPSADSATQRYTVYLEVFLPEGRTLVPGLTGEVSIIIAERDNAVLIPRRALVGDYVYVVEGSSVVLRKVEKGYESLNQVEVLSGLKVGEQVIIEQQDRFRQGDRVRPRLVSN